MQIFNSNYKEVGDLKLNLVLLTLGRIKIRYGNKFIDLLDNNGNIVVSPEVRNIINELSSNNASSIRDYLDKLIYNNNEDDDLHIENLQQLINRVRTLEGAGESRIYLHNIEIQGDNTTRIYTTIMTSFPTAFDVTSLMAYINNLTSGGFLCSGTVRTNDSGTATGRTAARLVPGTSATTIGILYHDTEDVGIAGPKLYGAGTGPDLISNVIDTVIQIM